MGYRFNLGFIENEVKLVIFGAKVGVEFILLLFHRGTEVPLY